MGIYALLVSFVFSLFIGYGGISASAAVVASSSDASDASGSFLEELKPENPGAGTLSAVRENADSVSPLILKIDLHMLREILIIPVIPDQANLIDQDQRIRRKPVFPEILSLKLIAAGNLPVTVDLPTFLKMLEG